MCRDQLRIKIFSALLLSGPEVLSLWVCVTFVKARCSNNFLLPPASNQISPPNSTRSLPLRMGHKLTSPCSLSRTGESLKPVLKQMWRVNGARAKGRLSCGVERCEEEGRRVGRSPLERCWHRHDGKNDFFLISHNMLSSSSSGLSSSSSSVFFSFCFSVQTVSHLSREKEKRSDDGFSANARKAEEQSSQGDTFRFKLTPANKWVL